MLRFRVFSDGKPADSVDLTGAYLLGSDGVPVRADIEFEDGEIRCNKRAAGPAGLAIVWPVKDLGRIMLDTTRLPERDKPYLLQLELARSRLMRLSHKQEDWEIDDPKCAEALTERVAHCRDLLIKALQADDEVTASRLADESLALSIQVAEDLSLQHAGTGLARRCENGSFGKLLFGCKVDLLSPSETYRKQLAAACDFVTVPISWRQIEPQEEELNWKPLDSWVEWLAKKRIPMKGSGLVDFTEQNLPDWLYIWEHDFERIRDLVYDHIRRVVNRYGQYINTWDVVNGIHATNSISFNFEQLMELTRMAAAVVKQLLPQSTTIVDMVAPWGEYYARNQRTIPPMLYADMAIQSGINFDAFGLQFYFGLGLDGMYVRDMFQVSSMIDRFSGRGKPLHITGVQVPSSTTVDKEDAWGGTVSIDNGGQWRGQWSEELQSRWLQTFYQIALSKPAVDTVTWRDLSDTQGHYLPHGGLLRRDLTPKPAYKQLVAMRKKLLGNGR
ncbi:MAG TPA: endo-1,4-beta-xylanase [Phycisphaerae bacterium]|nr:endo-1,4-beta-xylanase [Phycisphaerae bacterium]